MSAIRFNYNLFFLLLLFFKLLAPLSTENVYYAVWHGRNGTYLNLSLVVSCFLMHCYCNLPLFTLFSYKISTLPCPRVAWQMIFTQDWNQHYLVSIQQELITRVSNAQSHAWPIDAITKTPKTSRILFLSMNISMSCSIVLHSSQKVPIWTCGYLTSEPGVMKCDLPFPLMF